jgi:hypothetical protein
MLYSIIASFVMVAPQVVYCEFRHGCKLGSLRHVNSRRIKIRVNATQIDANIDTQCPAGSLVRP